MADKVECANCERESATGSTLCLKCEQKWMKERDAVVESAELLTKRSAEFAAYCSELGLPDPLKD